MEAIMNQPLYFCRYCKRELTQEAFYKDKRTLALDNYCKECRKTNSRKHRETNKTNKQFENKKNSYLVITKLRDPALRSILIDHALQTVRESIKRKQNKIKQNELWDE